MTSKKLRMANYELRMVRNMGRWNRPTLSNRLVSLTLHQTVLAPPLSSDLFEV
ncbi:MAG TPA: hypothetical protein H9848_05985 [Candidatus Parabacteroides intestinigallinarum]|uniref:Uncharacterized protein n=1 Tax=Candidatus Parabacteroides intestinigallinarum TaxID=2838722 RepID=A0A9D2BPA4_9BACT|nr:hypothetical protein [Candidatus Parabacteroides intestinigallinarum]